jgi:hypothetical protein
MGSLNLEFELLKDFVELLKLAAALPESVDPYLVKTPQ